MRNTNSPHIQEYRVGDFGKLCSLTANDHSIANPRQSLANGRRPDQCTQQDYSWLCCVDEGIEEAKIS